MHSADRIIRDLIDSFDHIEARFNLLRDIDREITQGNLSIPQTFEFVCRKLGSIFRATRSGPFLLSEGRLIAFDNVAENAEAIPHVSKGITIPDGLTKTEVNPSFFGKHLGNTIVIPIHYHSRVSCVIILQDDIPRPSVSRLCEPDSIEYYEGLRHQLSIVLRTKVDDRIEVVRTELVQTFFNNQLLPSSCWAAIASKIFEFLPDWAPARLEERPRVQLLTYSPGDRFLTLCADDSLRTFLAMPLKVDETICGILIEENKGKKSLDVLLVDPHKEKDRYQSYLFEKSLPHSELVIAIRDRTQKICGLINLEHPSKNVFHQLHIDILRDAARFLGPFVEALTLQEHVQQKRDANLLYVQSKLLQRMASAYRHKIGHWILRSRFALEKLENRFKDQKSEDYTLLLELKAFVDQFADGSEAFLADLPTYIFWGNVDIVQLAKDAVVEFDPDNLERTDGIKLTFEAERETQSVFASRLLRQHIYDLINNSCEAIRLRIAQGEIKSGDIAVTIERREVTDLQKKKTAPARVFIKIIDDGGGVSPEYEPHMFDFGFSTKRAQGGTGQGLAAARAFARSVGGDLYLTNRYPDGLTAVMILQEYADQYHGKFKHGLLAPPEKGTKQ